MSTSRGAVRGRLRAGATVLAVLALALLVPLLGGSVVRASPAPNLPKATGGGLGAVVLWNGKNVSSAGSPSAAFSLSKGQTAAVTFSYDALSTVGAVGNATLTLTYLGIVLTTSRASAHALGPSGSAQINWSFGPLYNALQGVFQLTASLLNPNGSSLWSESFYVFAKAPYLLESGAVIVLLILVVAELYWATSAIRDARRNRPSGPAPAAPPAPAATAGGPSAAGGGQDASASATGASAPSAAETPSPSGGPPSPPSSGGGSS